MPLRHGGSTARDVGSLPPRPCAQTPPPLRGCGAPPASFPPTAGSHLRAGPRAAVLAGPPAPEGRDAPHTDALAARDRRAPSPTRTRQGASAIAPLAITWITSRALCRRAVGRGRPRESGGEPGARDLRSIGVMVRHRPGRFATTGRVGTWRALLGEFAGTGILVAVGLSVVIFNFSPHAPLGALLGPGPRRALTGFLFGSVGALVTLSGLGRASGAHLNPVVTLAFLLQGRTTVTRAAGYLLAQCLGALVGAATLLAWGNRGASVHYGATLPGAAYGTWWAAAGEVGATFVMVLLLLVFVGTRRLRRFTPALFPPLYAAMVYLEAPISGTSTNPARSLGPAVVGADWHAWWIYWVGPAIGCCFAVLAFRSPLLSHLEIEVARVYHFAEEEVADFAAPRAPEPKDLDWSPPQPWRSGAGSPARAGGQGASRRLRHPEKRGDAHA